jgi:hypothetical protein
MPISYSINPDEKIVYVTFPEKLDLKSSLEIMRALAADERLGETFGVLVDLRALRSHPSIGEARLIASIASEQSLFLRNPTALVVSQVVQYGIGNMISLIASLQGAVVQAFYDIEEAREWLRGHLSLPDG